MILHTTTGVLGQTSPIRKQSFSVHTGFANSANLGARIKIASLLTHPQSASGIRICTPSHQNKQPLYVIDGVPTKDVSHLAINSIARLDVLQSKEVIRLYGRKGKSEVIQIMMK